MRSVICTVVWIERQPEEVFDFVTTFANWPRWYPATASVGSGSTTPAIPGDQTTELIWRAGRQRPLHWTVTACDRPRAWAIRGGTEERPDTTIAYTFAPDGSGTRFQRELSFERPPGWRGLLQRLQLKREARRALSDLKRVIEKGG